MKPALFLLLLLPIETFAKCNTEAIEYINSSGFSISFGSGNSSKAGSIESVNVPMTIDGKAACYRKTSKFEIKDEQKKGETEMQISVSPLKVEFENIPSPHVKQYLFIEKNPENPFYTKFHTMSFICSGDIPLSVEATSDRYLDVMVKSNQAEVKVTHFFATGQAAENLNKTKKGSSNNQATFDFYSKLYQEKTQRELEDAPKCEYNIPSIISETSIQVLTNVHREIASNYTTMGAKVVNGCTKDFSESMKNYLYENYKDNETLSSFKVKKKSKALIISAKK